MIPCPSKSSDTPPPSKNDLWSWKFKKHNFEKNTSKLFVKLYFKWPPSLSYSSHRCISAESWLFMCGIQNFWCFSTKIQQKLKIIIFDPNIYFCVFSKFCFPQSGPFSQIGSHTEKEIESKQNYIRNQILQKMLDVSSLDIFTGLETTNYVLEHFSERVILKKSPKLTVLKYWNKVIFTEIFCKGSLMLVSWTSFLAFGIGHFHSGSG